MIKKEQVAILDLVQSLIPPIWKHTGMVHGIGLWYYISSSVWPLDVSTRKWSPFLMATEITGQLFIK